MATRGMIDRLERQVDQLSAVIDPGEQPITVVVFAGESADYAMERHATLRPEHRGRLVRLEHRHNVERGPSEEEAAVFLGATSEDMAAARAWLASKHKDAWPIQSAGVRSPTVAG
jgi:hypothetical protein